MPVREWSHASHTLNVQHILPRLQLAAGGGQDCELPAPRSHLEVLLVPAGDDRERLHQRLRGAARRELGRARHDALHRLQARLCVDCV